MFLVFPKVLTKRNELKKNFFLLKIKKKKEWSGLISSPTLCEPTDCIAAGSSVHGIFQSRKLESVAISSSRVSSWPRNQILSFLYHIIKPGKQSSLILWIVSCWDEIDLEGNQASLLNFALNVEQFQAQIVKSCRVCEVQ